MSSKKLFSAFLQRTPLIRIGYPLGVVVVFCCIILSTFFSYRFFLHMIDRATTLPLFTVQQPVVFPLDAYRKIAPAFGLLIFEKKETVLENREKISVVFKNAQSRNDRVILLQDVLKNDGWSVTVIDDNEIRSENITTVAAKESQEKGAEAIASLLVNNGFIVSRGKPLAKEEKFDILITLGAY